MTPRCFLRACCWRRSDASWNSWQGESGGKFTSEDVGSELRLLSPRCYLGNCGGTEASFRAWRVRERPRHYVYTQCTLVHAFIRAYCIHIHACMVRVLHVMQAWVPSSSTARPCLVMADALVHARLTTKEPACACYSEPGSPKNKSRSICTQGRRGKGKERKSRHRERKEEDDKVNKPSWDPGTRTRQ